MAIIIPSSKTYDRQNPKVRDNVVERIEVGAVEILPHNEYGGTVYNTKVINYDTQKTHPNNIDNQVFSSVELISPSRKMLTVAYSSAMYIDAKTWKKKIYVPIIQYNKYIKNIFSGENKETGESIISCSVYGMIYKYDVYSKTPWMILNKDNITEGTLDLTRTNQNENTTTIFNFPSTIEVSPEGFNLNSMVTLGAYDNLKTAKFEEETIDGIQYYVTTLEVLAGITTYKFSGSNRQEFSMSEDYKAIPVYMEGECEQYIPTSIELTFRGDTIGIDLADKTVYVNGETAKKVCSIDGNELMQTENYVDYTAENRIKLQLLRGLGLAGNGYAILASPNKEIQIGDNLYYNGESALVVGYGKEGYEVEIIVKDGGEFYNKMGSTIDCYLNSPPEIKNHIQDLFQNTAKKYSKGKETAVIRCSIDDYFDQYGSKVISIDNSTRRMIFDLYDEVIPMVYGADGKDKAMSFYNDGSPKVFQVLSRKPYYDGAVWQELTLQEVDKPN